MKKIILSIIWIFLVVGFLETNIYAQEATPTPTPYVRTEREKAAIQKAIDAAHQNGIVTVIIVFDEPYVPFSPEYLADVRAMQNDLLQYLIPYQIKLHNLYTVIPGMSLEGDEAALIAIRDYPRVRYIELDAVVSILPIKRKRIRMF